MSMFTRTVSTYKVTAYKLSMEDGVPTSEPLGTAEYVGTSVSKTQARKALSYAGYIIPKGAHIEVEKVNEAVYGCTVEEFLSVAHLVERNAPSE